MKKEYVIAIQGALAAAGAFLSDRLGILFPVLCLLVAVWYLLNELLSIIENAGRMGGPVPEWLRKYIAVLKDKIDSDYDPGDKTA